MPEVNLNPKGDESNDTLNPDEKESLDGKDDLELLDFEEPNNPDNKDDGKPTEEERQKALDAYNAEMRARGLNYNFKSWEDVYKSNKNAQDIISKKGMENNQNNQPNTPVVTPENNQPNPTTPEAPVAQPSNVSERLLRVEQPEAQYVLEDIKRDHPGKDVYEVWNSSQYYQREAKVRAEAEAAKLRVSHPSGGGEGEPEKDEMSDKFMKNLPPGFSFKKK